MSLLKKRKELENILQQLKERNILLITDPKEVIDKDFNIKGKYKECIVFFTINIEQVKCLMPIIKDNITIIILDEIPLFSSKKLIEDIKKDKGY